jgi:hypothetical protein
MSPRSHRASSGRAAGQAVQRPPLARTIQEAAQEGVVLKVEAAEDWAELLRKVC